MGNNFDKNAILFRLHSAGMINQMLSVELALALSHVLNRQVCLYNAASNIWSTKEFVPEERKNLFIRSGSPIIFDLIDYPDSANIKLKDVKTLGPGVLRKSEIIENFPKNYYIRVSNDFNETEKYFANGRKDFINELYSNFDSKNKHVNFSRCAFGFYSYVFFNRTKELDKFLAGIKFKKPYTDLAEKIAKSIGDFAGAHIRLSDNTRVYNLAPTRLNNQVRRSIMSFKRKKKNRNLKLIVSTCDNDRVMKDMGLKCELIDTFIKDFEEDFRQLPYRTEEVFGLICLLVLSHAKSFIGTPGSTYSGYINRLRINRGLGDGDLFVTRKEPHHIPTGTYTWQGHKRKSALHWWREWPECKLNL